MRDIFEDMRALVGCTYISEELSQHCTGESLSAGACLVFGQAA